MFSKIFQSQGVGAEHGTEGPSPSIEEINAVDEAGETDLTYAIRGTRSDNALKLMSKGAHCDTVTKTGWTPLSLACNKKLPKVAKELLKVNEEGGPFLSEGHINTVNEEGETALTCAIASEMEDIALELLRKGANCDIITNQGYTPLSLACINGLNKVAEKILSTDISKDYINTRAHDGDGSTALIFAITREMPQIALELIKRGAQRDIITHSKWTTLSLACYWGLPEVAQELLKYEGDKGLSKDHLNSRNEDGHTALTLAISQHMLQVMKTLISQGADCGPGRTPLHDACSYSFSEGALEVLAQKKEEMGLHSFISPRSHLTRDVILGTDVYDKKMPQIALELIKRGAQRDIITHSKWTTLSLACYWGLPEVAQELLKYEGDKGLSKDHLNSRNEDGHTALTLAISQHMLQVMKTLISQGADCGPGRTPLHDACSYSFSEGALEVLAQKKEEMGLHSFISPRSHLTRDVILGTDVYDKKMPLEWAVSNNLADVVVELLKQGASMETGDRRQETKHEETNKKKVIEINSEDLGAYLDGLVTVDKPKEKWKKKSEEKLVLDYTFLSDAGQDNTQVLNSVLNLSPKHRELVKHPLVQAFLMMKWKKMLFMWKLWIFLKIIFFLLITVFAVVLYTSSGQETGKVANEILDAPRGECQNMTLPDVLTIKTPPNTTLMSMQFCFNTNTPKAKDVKPSSLKFDTGKWWLIIPQVFFALFTLFFVLVEIMQLLSSIRAWSTEVKNVLQLIILGISTYLCFAMFSRQCPDDVMTHFIATLLPMAYYEGLYEVGYHYRYSKYINMFNRVLSTFCKYFVAYIGMIVCFAGGYAIMLPPPGKDPFPTTFWGLLPKVFVMFTGEQEFMNMPFTSSAAYRVWETLYFLVFLIFTVVILMNMLNGLAVADARTMLEDSETDSLCALLETAAFWDKKRIEDKEEKSNQQSGSNACIQLFANLKYRLTYGWRLVKEKMKMKFHVLKPVINEGSIQPVQYFFSVYEGEKNTYIGFDSRQCTNEVGFSLDLDLKKLSLKIIHTREEKDKKETEQAKKEQENKKNDREVLTLLLSERDQEKVKVKEEKEKEKRKREQEDGERKIMMDMMLSLIEKLDKKEKGQEKE